MHKIIGFTGPIGVGKSTAAKCLVANHQFLVRPFARKLKLMLAAIGLSPSHLDGELKEEPCDLLCGVTPRKALQTLGSEWGRDMISERLWVNLWKTEVAKLAMPVLADDVRFPNEATAIRELGGIIIRIDNPKVTATTHQSETKMDEIRSDRLVRNLGTIDELYAAVLEAVL